MSLKNLILSCALGFAFPFTAWAGGGHDHHDHGHGHGHEPAEAEHEIKKGSHGGRLLKDGDFSLEVSIFEDGVPPIFRLYGYDGKKPIAAEKLSVVVTLKRLGRETTRYTFTAENDYLTSSQVVEEPHSFDVSVEADYAGKKSQWSFSSHEGRTELSAQAMRQAGIELAKVGPREISSVVRVYGKLILNENKVAHLTPRFPGVVKSVRADLGQVVNEGAVLAVIESNQTFQSYELRAPLAGVVLQRHATVGEFVSEGRELFVVADLSEVWADFQIYRDDFEQIQVGQKIRVDLGHGEELPGTISYLSPVTDEMTQSKLVRAVLPNPKGQLKPGLFVSGVLSSVLAQVPLAVERDAVQTFRDWNVVYITDGHSFQAMPVELGRRDGKFVEVISGLEAGEQYVSKNSFILKADIEKSGASHDH
jgi:cobalt-zinc-cadmium efflux system membrane fusion protein